AVVKTLQPVIRNRPAANSKDMSGAVYPEQRVRRAVLPWLLRIWMYLPGPLRFLYLRGRYGRFAIGVAALIRDQRGRVLVVHRTYSREEPWALPGGWLEGGESVEHTLERELLEETGLRVKVGELLAIDRANFTLVVLLGADLV